MSMKQIAAAKFKEQCLAILDQVGSEGLVITKRGKPIAKLIPHRCRVRLADRRAQRTPDNQRRNHVDRREVAC
jgi:prevent-host-death family protein